MSAATVLVDATAVPSDRSGVGRYVDGYLAAFTGEIAIACKQRDEQHYRTLVPHATVLPQRGLDSVPRRLIWEQLGLPGVARRAGATVIHSPHYTLPLFTRRKRVVTLHDATFFSDPQVHTPLKRIFFATWIRIASRIATALIVPSSATASELARYVPRARAPHTVAYHGVDEQVFHVPSADEVRAAASTLGLSDAPWIAFLGTVEPRKNLPALITAYRGLVAGWQPAWGKVPVLAIAGGRGWETGLDAEVEKVIAPGAVKQLGFIDLDLVRSFLGGSLLVAYPSLGEGFGLPVLEGMACGAPVLTTPRLALPEVGGDAVLYAEPDATALRTALEQLVSDDALRVSLATKGTARAATFTWAASAVTHQRVFERASHA